MEECPVCYEDLKDVKPLDCGHKIHTTCLEKHFKAECPICRSSHRRIAPKGKAPKSSAGRSTRYISSTAKDEIIVIKAKNADEEDKKLIEYVLTKKHRGETLTSQENKQYKDAMIRVGNFKIEIISIGATNT